MSYSTQIFTQHHGSSGTPSPIPYTDHVAQYTSTAVSQGATGYVTTSATGKHPRIQFYRFYYGSVLPGLFHRHLRGSGYTNPQVRQQIATYADSPESGSGGGGGGTSSATTAAIMERYVRTNVYHSNKSVVSAATAAGLTVDLPSPDSGIGAEAITPREQTAIPQ
ncbi:hypothetical protein L9F63_024521, partial [Diploptera punctata]